MRKRVVSANQGPATFFRGIRAAETAAGDAALDGQRAHGLHVMRSAQSVQLSLEQSARRDELESELERLRLQKPQMAEDEYYQALEPILVKIARLYGEKSVDPASESE